MAYLDSSYSKYCKQRAQYLLAHPELPGAGEAVSLNQVTGLSSDDIIPLFTYIVAKAGIERPVLCATLASAYIMQNGLDVGRDSFSLTMFKSACEWVASLPLNK